MKKIIVIISLIILFLPLISLQATDEDTQKGIELYWQATQIMNLGNFSGAKAKYEEAAQYLSGQVQQEALRMAEFVGKMSRKITTRDLLKDSYFSIIGEVKEEEKVWHYYNSEHQITILHLAIKGKKSLDDLVAAIGPDLFSKQMVVNNREGYLSKELTYIPGAASRIRMWYCDKDDTTNIVYENYSASSETAPDLLEWDMKSVSDVFKKVTCSKQLPIPLRLIGIIILVILAGILIWRLKLLQKVPKKIWVWIFRILAFAIIVFLILTLLAII